MPEACILTTRAKGISYSHIPRIPSRTSTKPPVARPRSLLKVLITRQSSCQSPSAVQSAIGRDASKPPPMVQSATGSMSSHSPAVLRPWMHGAATRLRYISSECRLARCTSPFSGLFLERCQPERTPSSSSGLLYLLPDVDALSVEPSVKASQSQQLTTSSHWIRSPSPTAHAVCSRSPEPYRR
jgi:hypothetical protein